MTSGIFDLDGTLASSARAHLESWLMSMRELGLGPVNIDVKKLLGRRAYDIASEILRQSGLPVEERLITQLIEVKTRFFRDVAPRLVKPMPCALEIYKAVKGSGGKFVVVTSSLRESALIILSSICISPDVLVSGDDVSSGKPSPEPVKLALARAGLRPSDTFGVGDTIYDVMAYRSAGLSRIYVVNGDVDVGLKSSDLEALGAVKVNTLCDVISLEGLKA